MHPDTNTFNMDIEEIKKLRNFIVLIMEYLRDELVYFAEKELYLYTNHHEIVQRSTVVNNKLERDIKSIYPE
ncbi:hypothetical protein FG144_18130 [Vibrio cholerae]|nr:hypothetical protein [Vibrio cholerae]